MHILDREVISFIYTFRAKDHHRDLISQISVVTDATRGCNHFAR